MSHIRSLALALVLPGTLPSSALARVAVIGTTARLTERSQEALRSAVKEAVEMALRGAKAMGSPHVELRGVSLLDEERVVIEVLASEAADRGPAKLDL